LDEVQKKIADYPKMLAEFEAVQQRERTEKTQEEELLEYNIIINAF
jgi:hypothetical protein